MRRLFLAIPLIVLASCGKEPVKTTSHAPENPIPVRTASAARVTWHTTYEATGTLHAKAASPISAKLMGYAKEVRAEIGDRVAGGQTLVALDSRDLDAAVSRAQAAREEVRSGIPEADSAIAAARAQVDLAQVTFNRMQELLNKRSVTNQEFDEASARLKAAQASYEMARARRTQLDSKMAQAEQDVRTASIQRTYADVTAPFSGVIVTKAIEPGALAVPGAPLFTIERDGPLRLEANVEESRLSGIRPGQSVAVRIDEVSNNLRGQVSEIVPSVDPASRTGVVKIGLPSAPGLKSGMFGRASFAAGGRETLTVPQAAVRENGQLQSVFVAENRTARLRLVSLGAKQDGRVEVLAGLKEGESVILSPGPNLRDGSPVEVRP